MLLYGLTPDSVTYNLWIGAAYNLGLIPLILQPHDDMLRKGCQLDVITYTKLLMLFCLGEELSDDSPDDFEGLDVLVSHVANLLSTECVTQQLALPGENMEMETRALLT
ncbi:hypothetical protein CQW23_09676 [Capsicum baccatum]|uniref:Uncharacterized protein n=1 Tax=Capsicum baccatum TaxID=33114 RepID=A0A2G2WXN3_CAPBA|nr:hypothetical protein CQW23_09676 [Capsicum baccatum]